MTITLSKIWPTNHFLKAKSCNFHFFKNDVTCLLVQMAYCTIHWILIYPVDGLSIHLLNSWGLFNNNYWTGPSLLLFHRCSTFKASVVGQSHSHYTFKFLVLAFSNRSRSRKIQLLSISKLFVFCCHSDIWFY